MAGYRFSIDRGGTFTDVLCHCPDGSTRTLKLLSHDPANYRDAPTEAIRRIMAQDTEAGLPAGVPLDTAGIEWIRMGTTVATNALLERTGARVGLVVTAGFADLLEIGNQARPDIFDLTVKRAGVLYERVVEVNERVFLANHSCQLDTTHYQHVKTVSGQSVFVVRRPDLTSLEGQLNDLLRSGVTSLAVVLMHSYIYPEHEMCVGRLAAELGFSHISLSSQLMPMCRVVPRGITTVLDAYLTPCIQQYLQEFRTGFKDNLRDVNVLFMRSDGGLTPMDSFCGSRALLSGPAGGVVGYAQSIYHGQPASDANIGASCAKHLANQQLPVIGLDMGGTSTDVSRYAGRYEHVYDTCVAGVVVQSPQLDIKTVAAGGGSRLFFRDGLFVVGPQSAGAHPGPVCYRKGGPLTVTDANLVLGRLLPDLFPHIFGADEDQPLDQEAARQEFAKLTLQVNEFRRAQCAGDTDNSRDSLVDMTLEEVALGFISVANETMCRPIRALTQARGYDTSAHVLACFGGAGGQHACAIARSLAMSTVYIHRYSGILSAYGLSLADVVHEIQEPCGLHLAPENISLIEQRFDLMREKCRDKFKSQGFDKQEIDFELYLNLRYEGTDCALMVTPEPIGNPTVSTSANSGSTTKYGDFLGVFQQRYRQEFGIVVSSDRLVITDDIRVRAVARHTYNSTHAHTNPPTSAVSSHSASPPKPLTYTDVYFAGGARRVAVYLANQLSVGDKLSAPAIIVDNLSTVLVEPGCIACILQTGDIRIDIDTNPTSCSDDTVSMATLSVSNDTTMEQFVDPVKLSVFSHRFMSIAEQMGRVLQRSSVSTNIKERLDFSCALFGADGALVSNAPHIPVHLGSMQEAVQYQVRALGDSLCDGDVILTNHPIAGGTHLPDLTVITPVFYRGEAKPVFFVASRGHHADIGGLTPGSMPPHSTSLQDEGATFVSFKLVEAGVFQEEKVTEALLAPALLPGNSGSRNLRDNLSDLRAQVAANHKGIGLMREMIDSYTLPAVLSYMSHVRSAADLSVRQLLRRAGTEALQRSGRSQLSFTDRLDNGSPIALTVQIDVSAGTAVFDFAGTGYEMWNNCNAPRAITMSAIIYCLRCMVGHDIPLNQGCLNPVQVRIPPGSLLSPSPAAAVVSGNVLTSQRLVDVVLGTFAAVAASQGCMNNVTFGDASFGYYETVAGGAGAGPGWHGTSGVHTHMTNTRITDPEIVELRYPIVLERFCLRRNSGGRGRFRGGDGVERVMLFRKPLTLSVLTERRVFAPYGLKGGGSGALGINMLVRNDGRLIWLGSSACLQVNTADRFSLLTPGGGGYGSGNEDDSDARSTGNPAASLATFVLPDSVYQPNRVP